MRGANPKLQTLILLLLPTYEVKIKVNSLKPVFIDKSVLKVELLMKFSTFF